MRARRGIGRVFAIVLALISTAASGQEFPVFQSANVLIVSREDLFSNSVLGKEILQLEQTEREALNEEDHQMGLRFGEEEKRLTALRDTMSQEDFQPLADAFDEKVVAARTEYDVNYANLIANTEARRRAFFGVIAPVLAQVMQRYNATIIIDRRSALLFDRNLDITRETIEFLDKAYSENPDMITQLGLQND